MKKQTMQEILDFLKTFDFSDYAIIEVCRVHYFTKREKKVFEYYPMYLQHDRTEAEIGYYLNLSQPTISSIFKRCRLKISLIKQLLLDADHHLEVIRTTCTENAYNVLCKALAGTRFVTIAKERKCTVFNVSLICSCALKRLEKYAPDTHHWAFSFLKTIGIVRTQK